MTSYLADAPLLPPRPPAWEERLSGWMLRRFTPGSPPHVRVPEPPDALRPYERFAIPRRLGGGFLDATWYPASAPARGAVLLAHPGLPRGQAYFHRRGRIEALRGAGYHALTYDASGYGGSSPVTGFGDRDVEDALRALAIRAPDLPRHVWGVSAGGYFAHLALSRIDGVVGAMFEDVSPHLFEYGTHQHPVRWAVVTIAAAFLPRTTRFLDLRRHAPRLRIAAAAYVAGDRDREIPLRDSERLAALAGAPLLVGVGATHLETIKRETDHVIALALETFRRAEAAVLEVALKS